MIDKPNLAISIIAFVITLASRIIFVKVNNEKLQTVFAALLLIAVIILVILAFIIK